jgi:hypothetical protein
MESGIQRLQFVTLKGRHEVLKKLQSEMQQAAWSEVGE